VQPRLRHSAMRKIRWETDAERKARVKRITRQIDQFMRTERARLRRRLEGAATAPQTR